MWKIIMMLLAVTMILPDDKIINFGNTGNTKNWTIVNDGVMGGLSQSTAVAYDDYVLFSGNTSLKNNGGFASYRSPYEELDLSPYKAVEIRFKSTGRTFSIQLDPYKRWWNPNYKSNFSNTTNEWTVVKIPLANFEEYRIGRKTGDKIKLSQLDDIKRLGIIIFDKKEGPFELQIDYIKFI